MKRCKYVDASGQCVIATTKGDLCHKHRSVSTHRCNMPGCTKRTRMDLCVDHRHNPSAPLLAMNMEALAMAYLSVIEAKTASRKARAGAFPKEGAGI